MLIWDYLLDAQTPQLLSPAVTKRYKEMQRKDIAVSVKEKQAKGNMKSKSDCRDSEIEYGKKTTLMNY